MSVNILVDFIENGKDKNEPHIVQGTKNVYLAGIIVMEKLKKQGCVVQSMFVVEGDLTLEQLHDMANYGDQLDMDRCHLLYMSPELQRYLMEISRDPEKGKATKEELERTLAERQKKRTRCGRQIQH